MESGIKAKVNVALFSIILFFSIPGYANWAAYKAISHQELSAMPFIGTTIENGDHVNISRYSISQTTIVDIDTPFNTELKWTWTGPAQILTTSITFIKFAEEPAPNPEDPPIEYGCWLLENSTCHNGIYTATRYIALGDMTEPDLGNWTFDLSYGGSSIYSLNFVLATGLLEKTGGDLQTGIAGSALPAPLEITFTDSKGEPLENIPVKFQITTPSKPPKRGGAATIAEDAPNAVSSTEFITATTDANGVAAAILTLGIKEGIYGVTATSGKAKFQSQVFVSNTNAALGFDLGKELGVPCGAKKCGNPINITVGNKYQQETDIPNITPSLLEFTRSYNSMGSDSQDMGWGWQHNYSRSIETVPSGKGRKATTTTYANRFDGKRYTFVEDGGILSTDADIHDELVADANGWTYTQDNTIEKYDSSGRLILITYLGGKGTLSPDNPDSRTVTLTYNILDQLVSVTDDVGSSLNFTYSAFDRIISVTDQAMRTWEYTYGILGNLETVTNPDGTVRDYLYEDLNNNPNALTGIIDELGNRYATWAYDVDGMAISSYHANNVDRIDVEYHEDMSRTVTNNRGGITTYQVTTQNQSTLITSVDGVGCSTCAEVNSSFKYDGQNNKVEQTVNGVTTQYRGYGDTKYPRDIIIGAGTTEENTTSIFYDSRFNGLESYVIGESIYPPKDPGNTVVPYNTLTKKVYDDAGNVLSITENGFTPDGIALAPKVTTFTYDGPLGQVSQIDGPRTDVSDITTFEYYPNEPSFDDIRARLKRVTNALGQVVRDNIQYSATGKVKSEARLNGMTISNTYYAGNDRIWIMNESNGTESNNTRWRYYDTGEVWDITTDYGGPNESIVFFGYDNARRLTSIRDGAGNYRTFILDTEGNLKEEKTSDGNELHQHLVKTFDAYDRLKSVSQSNESLTYSYAPDHTVSSELDGNNVTTSYSYDGLKRLTSTTENSGVSTLSTTQDFDRQGNLITVAGATNASLSYDDFGNLRSSKIDNQGATTYTYDEAGNRLTQLDGNNRLIQYQYDALNRISNVDAPGTADDITYGYDTCLNGQGQLCSMTMASGTTAYTYDGLGRVTGHQGIGYTYDSAGRTKTISYPSGSVISYNYDLAGQIQSINDTSGGAIASGITHEPFGPVDGFNYGNGLTYSASFDSANRPKRQETIGLFDRSYNQYDGNGNLLQLSETKHSVSTLDAFSYDWSNRLQTASGSFGTRDYTYASPLDFSYSNRTSHDEGSEIFDYDYRPNSGYSQLLDIGIWATSTELIEGENDPFNTCYLDPEGCASKTIWNPGTSQASERLYDLVGNEIDNWIEEYDCVYTAYTAEEIIIYGLTDTHYYDCTETITNWGFEYSANNQINRVTLGGLEQTSYEYNALRQRVSKTLPDGSVTNYIYGLDGLLLAELDGLDNVNKEYVYLSGKLLAVRDFSSGIEQLYYAHTDHLGMPELLTDAAGHMVWSGDFDPFGKAVAIDEDVDGDGIIVTLNIRFPGQYYDAETGLYYNWNRYYDAEIGQYTSSDPIGLDGGLNTYTYVGGNPVGRVDPEGLEVFVGQHGAFVNSTNNPFYHAAIVLAPDNPNEFVNHPLFKGANGTQATLGGQAFGPNSEFFELFGKLVSAPNYPGDAPSNLQDLTKVCANGQSDTEFIKNLIKAYESYNNDATYDPFPDSFGWSYNSNSYVSGLIESAGGTVPTLPGIRPGYSSPLPIP